MADETVAAIFGPPPPPPTELGRYRVLSSTAGVRVSPLALGGMSIGDAWKSFMGSLSKEDAFKLLDAYYDAGGNFIDTANNYQNDQSEMWIGEWMQKKGIRDQIVLATKFTMQYRAYNLGKQKPVNYSGNTRKSLHISVRESLDKLKTDYIDILYVHWWDFTTSIEEVMDSLHMLVEKGTVLYLGISDTPAWIVSAANTYARLHGKTQFSIYQGEWNVSKRDFERDIIPMARQFGMALAPWNVINGGRFRSKKQREAIAAGKDHLRMNVLAGTTDMTEEEIAFSDELEKVGKEVGCDSVSAVALAYVMQKTTGVFPIVGGRKVDHLMDNIKALSIHLSDEQIERLEAVKPFDIGFPMNFVGPDPHVKEGQMSGLLASSGNLAFQMYPKSIGHQ